MKISKILVVLFTASILFGISSCKKEEADEATCGDGIMNGDETGIDCGGTDCDSCESVYLCNGTDEDSFLPLDVVNKWNYSTTMNMGSESWEYAGEETINSTVYQKFLIDDSMGFDYYQYYREAANGEIFILGEYDTEEYLLVSDLKDVGYTWENPNSSSYSFKINSKDASFSTSKCEYTGLIEVYKYDNGELDRKLYYKNGIGYVGSEIYFLYTFKEYLASLELN